MLSVMNRSSSIDGSGTTSITRPPRPRPRPPGPCGSALLHRVLVHALPPSYGRRSGRRTRVPARPPRTARRGSSGRSRPSRAASARAADRATIGTSFSSAIRRICARRGPGPWRRRSGAGLLAVVGEGDREVGRVGDDDVGLRDGGHHPRPRHLHLAAAHRGADLGRELVYCLPSSLTSCLVIFIAARCAGADARRSRRSRSAGSARAARVGDPHRRPSAISRPSVAGQRADAGAEVRQVRDQRDRDDGADDGDLGERLGRLDADPRAERCSCTRSPG